MVQERRAASTGFEVQKKKWDFTGGPLGELSPNVWHQVQDQSRIRNRNHLLTCFVVVARS